MRSWKKARKIQTFDAAWIKTKKKKVLWPIAVWRMFS